MVDWGREDFRNIGRVLAYLSAYGKDSKKMRNDNAMKEETDSGVMSRSSRLVKGVETVLQCWPGTRQSKWHCYEPRDRSGGKKAKS